MSCAPRLRSRCKFRWSVLFGHVVIAWLTLSRDRVGKDERGPKICSLHAPEVECIGMARRTTSKIKRRRHRCSAVEPVGAAYRMGCKHSMGNGRMKIPKTHDLRPEPVRSPPGRSTGFWQFLQASARSEWAPVVNVRCRG